MLRVRVCVRGRVVLQHSADVRSRAGGGGDMPGTHPHWLRLRGTR